jgi:hypothetical protein
MNMKKLVVRTLGLTAIALLPNLPSADAAVGECHIRCCNGHSRDIPTQSIVDCCQIFEDLCDSEGEAYREAKFGIVNCTSFRICAV